MDHNLVELEGIVQIPGKKYLYNHENFQVKIPGSLIMVHGNNFYLPLRDGDHIIARGKQIDNTSMLLTQKPLINILGNRNNIISTIQKLTKEFNYVTSFNYYEQIKLLAGSDENIISYISNLSHKLIFEGDKEVIKELSFLNPDKAQRFLYRWDQEYDIRKLYLIGFKKGEIKTAVNNLKYTTNTLYNQAVENVFVIPNISNELAIEINSQILRKITSDEESYCGSFVKYIWKFYNDFNSNCVPVKIVSNNFPNYTKYLDLLIKEYQIIVHNQLIYLKPIFDLEMKIIKFFVDRKNSDPFEYNSEVNTDIVIDGETHRRIPAYFKYDEFTDEQKIENDKLSNSNLTKEFDFSLEQKFAIQGALDHTVSIITGGAGSGKTSCLKNILNNIRSRNQKYILCSFTGKAVKRIREVTGDNSATTIHRFIFGKNANDQENNKKTKGFGGFTLVSEKEEVFDKLENTKYQYLIIDEMSMVNAQLFYQLISKIPDYQNIKVIMIGDPNQLEPIKGCNLFLELIRSKTINTFVLQTNFRNIIDGNPNGIVINSQNIVNNKFLNNFEYSQTDNFYLVQGIESNFHNIIELLKNNNIKLDNFICLSPYNKNLNFLNDLIRSIYNDPKNTMITIDRTKKNKIKESTIYQVGDRVMLIKNISNCGIFNGDIGNIIEIHDCRISFKITVKVNFPGVGDFDFIHEYGPNVKNYIFDENPFKDDDDEIDASSMKLDLIIPAYAITIDKSQGSEYEYVVIYANDTNPRFLNRNRFYTSITRAKKWLLVYFNNSKNIIQYPIQKPAWRYSGICQELIKNLKPLTSSEIITDCDFDDYDFDPDQIEIDDFM